MPNASIAILLGWRSGPDPVWSASDWASLGTALAHMHRSSTWPLFYSWTMADARNPTVNKVHIGQDGLGLGSRDYYLGKDPYSDPYLVAYHRYLDKLLELSSSILPQAADPSYRNATAHSVIAFETAIAAAQLPSAVLRNPAVSYNAWTRAQLQNETGPNFFWGAYQNALYSDVRGPGQSVPEPIIVDAPPYYRSLFGIVELTPVPTVMAYLQLMWLANSASSLPGFCRRTVRAEQSHARCKGADREMEDVRIAYRQRLGLPDWPRICRPRLLPRIAAVDARDDWRHQGRI